MVYLIGGENVYLSIIRLDELKKKYSDGIKIINADELASAREVVDTTDNISFITKTPLIILKRLFKSKKQVQDDISQYIKINKNFNMIIWEDGKIDKRLNLYRLLKKIGIIEEYENLSYYKLRSWLKSYISKRIKYDEECLDLLILKIGTNQMMLAGVIDNLIDFLLIEKKEYMTTFDIDDFVEKTAEENIWNFLDAVSSKDKKSALTSIESLVKNQGDFPLIVAMITRQLRILTLIKFFLELNTNYSEIVNKLRLHPFVAKKAIENAKNFTLDQLKMLYKKLLMLDLVVKEGKFKEQLALSLFIAAL